MRDYFDILGVSRGAPAVEIRRAVRRHASRTHPDFRTGQDTTPVSGARALDERRLRAAAPADAAMDFVDMAAIVERMQIAFLGTG